MQMSSDNATGVLSNAAIRLGPTWRGDGGGSFQPPKRVVSEEQDEQGSNKALQSDRSSGVHESDPPTSPRKQPTLQKRFSGHGWGTGWQDRENAFQLDKPIDRFSKDLPERKRAMMLRLSKSEILSYRPANTYPPPDVEIVSETTVDLISFDPLLPESEHPLDHDTINRIWNAASRGSSSSGMGRGRGSARRVGHEREHDDDFLRDKNDDFNENLRPDDLWDDPGNSAFDDAEPISILDLEDMVLQSGKFKKDMEEISEKIDVVIISDEKINAVKEEQDELHNSEPLQNSFEVDISNRESHQILENQKLPRPDSNPGSVNQNAQVPEMNRGTILSALGIFENLGSQSGTDFYNRHHRNGSISMETGHDISRGNSLHAARVLEENLEIEHRKQAEKEKESLIFNEQPPFHQKISTMLSIDPWFYLDPSGNRQGPFTALDMRKWFESGYFAESLPLCQGVGGSFVPLLQLFPNPAQAFVANVKAELAHIRTEQLRQEEVLMEHQRIRERELASAAEERLRVERAHQQKMLEEQRKMELLKNEHMRREQEQLQAEELRRDKVHQEKIRHEKMQQEKLRLEQIRLEQLRQEQLRQEQLRQEQLRQEQLRQEQLVRSQLRKEELRLEQIKQKQIAAEEAERGKTAQAKAKIDAEAEMLKVNQQESIQPPAKNPWIEIQAPRSNLSLSVIQAEEAKKTTFNTASDGIDSVHYTPFDRSLQETHEQKDHEVIDSKFVDSASALKSKEMDVSIKPAPQKLIVPLEINPLLNKSLTQRERKALEKKMRQEAVEKEKLTTVKVVAWGGKQSTDRASTPSGKPKPLSFEEIQREEQEEAEKQKRELDSQLKMMLGVSTNMQFNSTWGAQKVTKVPSLKEIQQREAEAKNAQQKAKEGGSGGWVVRASAPQPPTTVPHSTPQTPLNNSQAKQADGEFWGGPKNPTPIVTRPSTTSHSDEKQKGGGAVQARSNFGGMGMPQDMAVWAKSELKKLGGSEDITLLDFCMSVSDASEVREVLAAYLGSTPQVSSFASNFLFRKAALKKGSGKGALGGTKAGATEVNQGQNAVKKKKAKK